MKTCKKNNYSKPRKLSKLNIFLDMDGVLADQLDNMVEDMYKEHFFRNLPPVPSMVNLAKKLISHNYNIFILSTVIDSPYCAKEKDLWLDEHLPEIPKNNRFFVPIGTTKADYIVSKLNVTNSINILIDDFTVNLVSWDIPNSLGIKALNNINNTKGTWLKNGGAYICSYEDPNINFVMIEKLIKEKLNKEEMIL